MISEEQHLQSGQSLSRRRFLNRAALTGAGVMLTPASFASALAGPKDTERLPDETGSVVKTVLLINAHLKYPGWSEGTLNKSFCDVAKSFFIGKGCAVLETVIGEGYDAEDEVSKHLQADLVILQTPVNWISTPWIHKRYVDEVFNAGLKSQRLLAGDGRDPDDARSQYGTGGKMRGKKFMISATWNAAEKDFYDPAQYLYHGKGPEDVFYNVTTNYRFFGFSIAAGYNCFDVCHNKHIKHDLELYPAHLSKISRL